MKQIMAVLFLIIALSYETSAWSADAKDCKDHPLFSRMSNFEIYRCATTEFDAVAFPKPELKNWSKPEDYINAEGKIYAISYKLKKDATPPSSLQIIRNFQNAVKKDGGKVMVDTGRLSLPQTATKYLKESPGGNLYDAYTTMTLNKGGREFWVYLCASEPYKDYMLLIVEKQEMKQEISVNELEQKINKDGFLTFYINFDSGKAIIKTDSTSAIEQIAALLKAVPALKVSIEGHTDNVGTSESNKKLSEERAKAVMSAVMAKGIAAGRLSAVGRGQDAPIADNRKEEGRALNRRVEVVKK